MFAPRRRRDNYGVFLLAMQIFSFGYQNIPPVTLSTMLLNIAIYLNLIPLPSLTNICLNPFEVLKRREYWRLLLACLFHVDDMHLYYNMISFMWKGRTLEHMFGSAYFAFLLAIFSLLCNLTHIMISHLLFIVTQSMNFEYGCAVGFSGVIFALKVLTTEYTETGDVFIMGILPIPSKYALWAELILISFMVPEASFIGHLSGILVGLCYVHGPLKKFVNTLYYNYMEPIIQNFME